MVAVNFPPETVYLWDAASQPAETDTRPSKQYSRSTRTGGSRRQSRTDVAIVPVRQACGECLSPYRIHIVDSDKAQRSAPERNALGRGGYVVRDGRVRDDVVAEGGHAYDCGPTMFAEPAIRASRSGACSIVYGEN